MQNRQCAECAHLQYDVITALERLEELIAAQLEAFRSNDQAQFMRLDKELELSIGAKERAIGALRQHGKEHESPT
jgi:hypothetical protein